MRDSVPSARYSSVCNVLRQWRIWLIPTYKLYLLYDTLQCYFIIVHYILYILYNVIIIVHYILYILYNIIIVHYILYILYNVINIVHYIL